jgi:ribosome-associated protein
LAESISLETVINWLKEKKAENIRIYNVQDKCSYTDVIVVCEGSADVHNKAIANHIVEMAKENKLTLLSKKVWTMDNGCCLYWRADCAYLFTGNKRLL